MTSARLLLLLPLLAMQTGCVLITSYSKGEDRIQQWVKEKQYGNALKALNNIDPKDPDYLKAAEKRKQVEALAAAYEHDVRQHNIKVSSICPGWVNTDMAADSGLSIRRWMLARSGRAPTLSSSGPASTR